MRKYLISLSAAALLLGGCQKESDPTPDRGDDKVTFSGSLSATTKTSLGDTDLDPIAVLWSAGDALGAYTLTEGAAANNARATISDGAGTGNAHFTSLGITMADAGNVFYLYYPHNNTGATSYYPNSGNPYVTSRLSREQEQQAPGDFSNFGKYGFSVAVSEPADKGEEVSFAMNHVLSNLRFSLWGSDASLAGYSIDEIAIAAPEGLHLAGEFKADFLGNYEAVPGSTPDYSNGITLKINKPATIETSEAAAQKFLMTLLPIDLTGEDLLVTVKVSKNGDQSMARSYSRTFAGADFASSSMNKINDDFSLWQMTTAVTTGTSAFVSNLLALQALADAYVPTIPSGSRIPASNFYKATYSDWLTATYIRQLVPGYTVGSWPSAAGNVDAAFTAYVAANAPSVQAYFSGTTEIIASDAGSNLEVRHMGATLSALTWIPSGFLALGNGVSDDLAGWAGDLQTFLEYNIYDQNAETAGTATIAWYRQKTLDRMGQADTHYSTGDLLADIDAYNIWKLMDSKKWNLSKTAEYYYTHAASGYLKRFTSFVGGADYNTFLTRVNNYTKKGFVSTYSSSFVVSSALEKGGAAGYSDYIFNLVAQE